MINNALSKAPSFFPNRKQYAERQFHPFVSEAEHRSVQLGKVLNMPLHRTQGHVIAALEGVYFPMASIAEHRVTCVVTRATLCALAGRNLSIEQFVETFAIYRRDIEAVASVLYDRKETNRPRTLTVGLLEFVQAA